MALGGFQVVTALIRLIGAIHLSVGVYIMYNLVIPPEVLKIDSAYGGKFKYLTFWNVCLNAVYFWFAFVDSLVFGCSDNEKKPLTKIRDHYFVSVVFPLSSFVTFTFWGLFAIDRELVMPKGFDPFFPPWLNHTLHTSIVIYSALELVTSYHRCTQSIFKQCIALWLITLAYIVWCHVVHYKTNLWVYPILNELNTFCRMLFFLGCLILATVFLAIGFYGNNIIWKSKIKRESRKKKIR